MTRDALFDSQSTLRLTSRHARALQYALPTSILLGDLKNRDNNTSTRTVVRVYEKAEELEDETFTC